MNGGRVHGGFSGFEGQTEADNRGSRRCRANQIKCRRGRPINRSRLSQPFGYGSQAQSDLFSDASILEPIW